MGDLSDLLGIYPTSIRWNAETGFLAISVFNSESGERELQEIELGRRQRSPSTWRRGNAVTD